MRFFFQIFVLLVTMIGTLPMANAARMRCNGFFNIDGEREKVANNRISFTHQGSKQGSIEIRDDYWFFGSALLATVVYSVDSDQEMTVRILDKDGVEIDGYYGSRIEIRMDNVRRERYYQDQHGNIFLLNLTCTSSL